MIVTVRDIINYTSLTPIYHSFMYDWILCASHLSITLFYNSIDPSWSYCGHGFNLIDQADKKSFHFKDRITK